VIIIIRLFRNYNEVDTYYDKYRITITIEYSNSRQLLYNRLLEELKKSNIEVVRSFLDRHKGIIVLKDKIIGIYEPECSNSFSGDLVFIGNSYKYITYKLIEEILKDENQSNKILEVLEEIKRKEEII